MRPETGVLYVPSARAGDGIGHLRRCLDLVRESSGGAILIGENPEEQERARAVVAAAGIDPATVRLVTPPEAAGPWKMVVIDRRSTTEEELLRLAPFGPIVALDEGGPAREVVPYLIDALPGLRNRSAANVSSAALQIPPRARRAPNAPDTGKVLITFGGEDPAGLSARMAAALIAQSHYRPEHITIVAGPLFRADTYPRGTRLITAPAQLREILHDYDIVFTSFGLTAYEAVSAGSGAILFNPTRYHRALSMVAGFPEIGVGRVRRARLRRLVSRPEELRRTCARITSGQHRSIADLLQGLDFSMSARCPACGRERNTAIGRFDDRTFFRCAACTVAYQLDFRAAKQTYAESYFTTEYQAQYGRTYLEDFEAIRSASRARLQLIASTFRRLIPGPLLDVGCAFGPFLVEAAAAGWSPHGVDVSREAVAYVGGTLGLPAVRSSFEELEAQRSFGIARYRAVTMWYVIEHFVGLADVLRKVNRLLEPGGIFAFSTPNLAGVSGRSDLRRFLERSPADHYTIWSPRIAASVLRRFGFEVAKIRVTGHHPERFPIPGSGGGWRHRLLGAYSKLAGFGDTFECYARKVEESA